MKKKSFTLVEIMIVVAIIAILAAIAVPALAANRKSANNRAADSNIKMVEAAVNSCLADNPQAKTADVTFQSLVDGGYMKDVAAEADLAIGGADPVFGAGTITYDRTGF